MKVPLKRRQTLAWETRSCVAQISGFTEPTSHCAAQGEAHLNWTVLLSGWLPSINCESSLQGRDSSSHLTLQPRSPLLSEAAHISLLLSSPSSHSRGPRACCLQEIERERVESSSWFLCSHLKSEMRGG